MQLSGSLVQSVLHRNLSHVIQPIGGVKARPLSSEYTDANKTIIIESDTTHFSIFIVFQKLKNKIKIELTFYKHSICLHN